MTGREPVRVAGWASLMLGTVLVGAIGWASGVGLRPLVAILASMWLTTIGGLEWARAHVTPWNDSNDL